MVNRFSLLSADKKEKASYFCNRLVMQKQRGNIIDRLDKGEDEWNDREE